jgi:hypothetical protein
MGDEPGSSVFIARANLTARQEPRPTHLVERCDLSLLPFLSSTRRSRLPSRLVKHHLPLLLGSIVCIWALYVTRPYTDVLSRASFATGYPALVLLGATLLIGPLNLLRHRPNPVSIDLRRDLGIWAGILAIVHTAIGQCVHLRGRPWLYYVYGPAEHYHGLAVRHDLFGFANYIGAFATLILSLSSQPQTITRCGPWVRGNGNNSSAGIMSPRPSWLCTPLATRGLKSSVRSLLRWLSRV